MQLNWIVILLTALVPMIVGFIWYHPKFLGNAWMKACGLDEEKLKKANMGLIFALSFLFSIFISMSLQFTTIHQFHINSIFIGEPGINDPTSEVAIYMNDFFAKYGDRFRTFKHGSLHGFLFSLFMIFPIMATNALFERKSWKYIFINVGYWTVSLTIMGGILCAYA
jgi:hypothetical protein